jgi:hypothetical protein
VGHALAEGRSALPVDDKYNLRIKKKIGKEKVVSEINAYLFTEFF